MSFEWRDFLTLAEGLQRQPDSPGPEEASLRSAISRAYYAAYRTARDFAETRDNFKRWGGGGAHDQVIDHFLTSTEKTRREIGGQLYRLHNLRKSADYDLKFRGNLQEETDRAIKQTRLILESLKKLIA